MKRTLSLILAAVLILATALTSCASGGKAVMKLGNATVDEAMYRYWMATYKARYVSAYTDIKDSTEYWKATISEDSDTTNEKVLNDLIRSNIKTNLAAMAIFAEEGLTVSDSAKAEVDEYIQSMVDELADGSRKTLNADLAEFGVNINLLRNIFINEDKVASLLEYFYGESGKNALTDADRDKFYRENYVRFAQININDAFVYEEDESGTYIQDENGTYKTRGLNAEEKAAKDKVIAEIDALLADGGDVEALYNDYSENTDYPNGYYFSSATGANYVGEIVTKAFTLAEGEWTKITSDKYGTFYIKRLPLDEKGYSNADNSDFFDGFDDTLKQELFDDMLSARFDGIEIDEELLDAISVADVTPNYYYY